LNEDFIDALLYGQFPNFKNQSFDELILEKDIIESQLECYNELQTERTTEKEVILNKIKDIEKLIEKNTQLLKEIKKQDLVELYREETVGEYILLIKEIKQHKSFIASLLDSEELNEINFRLDEYEEYLKNINFALNAINKQLERFGKLYERKEAMFWSKSQGSNT
jgi:hypothetical protein